MPKRIILDKTFLRIAREISKLSNCVSHKVGCVLVKDGRIVSMGYNGTPAGYINCDEKFGHLLWDGELPEKHRSEHHRFSMAHEIHAEKNAMLFAAKNGIAIDGCTCYCTLQPCGMCIKEMCQVNVRRVVFIQEYDLRDGVDDELNEMARQAGIELEQIDV